MVGSFFFSRRDTAVSSHRSFVRHRCSVALGTKVEEEKVEKSSDDVGPG